MKIAITGPESSGKSHLSEALARHYGTSWAREFAREYLSEGGGGYELSDLDEICRGQVRNEERAIKDAKDLCFFDTDMLVLKVWSEYRFGTLSPVLEAAVEDRTYDFRLLCRPDLPWHPDPLRESPSVAEREELFDIYLRELLDSGAAFFIVEGVGQKRVNAAIDAVDEFVRRLRDSKS